MGKVLQVHPVNEDHQVVSFKSTSKAYRREPCPGCPWKVSNTGNFPAGAFEVSARTAYDMSPHVFACHESGQEKSATCAGFLLRNSVNNMGVRLGLMRGKYDLSQVSDGGHELFPSYKAMAIANGVPEEAECLKQCRSDDE